MRTNCCQSLNMFAFPRKTFVGHIQEAESRLTWFSVSAPCTAFPSQCRKVFVTGCITVAAILHHDTTLYKNSSLHAAVMIRKYCTLIFWLLVFFMVFTINVNITWKAIAQKLCLYYYLYFIWSCCKHDWSMIIH